MKTIKLPKGYKLGKAIEINPGYNPDSGPEKWIEWDEDLKEWFINDPTPVVEEVCIGSDCELCIYHDPEYGLLPSTLFAKALRKHARCDNCGAPPQTNFGLCMCGSKHWFCYGEASAYRVSYAVWESELGPLWRKELHRVNQKKRYLRKQLARLELGKNPYTTIDIKKLSSIQNDTCYYCGTSINEGFHIEHLEPLSRGGNDTINNIMLACPKCNLDNESPRVCRRLHFLRGLSNEQIQKIFPGNPGTCSTYGV